MARSCYEYVGVKSKLRSETYAAVAPNISCLLLSPIQNCQLSIVSWRAFWESVRFCKDTESRTEDQRRADDEANLEGVMALKNVHDCRRKH